MGPNSRYRANDCTGYSKSTLVNEEIHMYAKAAVTSARLFVGAATVVCTMFAGNVVAKDKIVTVAIHVSAQGLDLSQPADAQTFYTRLQNAAWVACTRGDRVGLSPVEPLKVCYEKALGDAVHASNRPIVTHIYLDTHTLQEAAVHGIEVPAQVAAK
jgi:UrcA family protein